MVFFKVYLTRNYYLHKDKFSINSLLTLYKLFQRSRICYGLESFIYRKTIVDRVNRIAGKFTRAILQLKNIHVNRMLLVVLGEISPEMFLIIQLLKNLGKYRRYFGQEEGSLWREYFQNTEESIKRLYDSKEEDPRVIEMTVKISFSKTVCAEKGQEARSELPFIIKKYWWKYISKSNSTIIKLVCRVGWLSSREDYKRDCKLCGSSDICGDHYLDECEEFRVITNPLLREMSEIRWYKQGLTPTTELRWIFFNQEDDRREVGKVIRMFDTLSKKIGILMGKKIEEIE